MGPRFKLGRSTKVARNLRADPTEAEKRHWHHLRARQLNGFKFNRQLPIAGFICDFVCREATLIVEIGGGQHDFQREADAARTTRLTNAGYRVIRFWNNDVLGNVDGVLIEIARSLEARALPPAPSRTREGEEDA